jgi:uncharacterized protein
VESAHECLVMAKPAGPACNLRCAYCYYTEKASLFPAGPWRMPEDLLEAFIRQRIQASPGPVTHFEWHGGEPTLLGLEYFRSIVGFQRAHCPPGRTITNGLQTNGTLLDEAWADFLGAEGFSVGLSLDGPAECHDAFRVTAGGEPTHARVLRAFRLLKERGVFCNVLCVLHAGNAAAPDAVYDFFRGLGASHLQFLPLVIPLAQGGVGAPTAPAEAVGAFLCRLFDRWIRADVGRIVIQAFDEALRPLYGVPHALCVHRETCGDVAVLEHDGGFYACDHFVDGGHRMGSVRERGLAALARDPRMAAFGAAKRDSLPRACRACDVLSFCNGGCPKDRILSSADGEPGLNYLCPAYQAFFRHCRPELSRLAEHMKAGGRLRAFRPL